MSHWFWRGTGFPIQSKVRWLKKQALLDRVYHSIHPRGPFNEEEFGSI